MVRVRTLTPTLILTRYATRAVTCTLITHPRQRAPDSTTYPNPNPNPNANPNANPNPNPTPDPDPDPDQAEGAHLDHELGAQRRFELRGSDSAL